MKDRETQQTAADRIAADLVLHGEARLPDGRTVKLLCPDIPLQPSRLRLLVPAGKGKG